ncbi:MAG: hypothetical protein H0V30_05010 [Chitinophagaceae bacterium]|jgi:hypothetical protein|nr:hypothetical protein [Chitinophagaceae bacterium]
MERIEALISKLNDQYRNKAGATQMLITIRMLEAALADHSQQSHQTLGTSKVAVVLPRSSGSRYSMDEEIKEVKEVEKVSTANKSKVLEKEIHYPKRESVLQEQLNMGFDPILEIPTLTQQHSLKEINEAVAIQQESLNDRLKQSKIELAETLKETPIRDLRKAVGVNDRFVFISELFRGDEAMYERSIKTINGFNIYAEAEYWINRELKTKIGWDDSRENVKHFYKLVKRRFS